MRKLWMLLMVIALLAVCLAVPSMAAETSTCYVPETDTYYQSLGLAFTTPIGGVENGDLIRLVADETQPVTINKEVWLDLNGHDITGTVTITSTGKLYLLDSANNGYTDEGAVVKNIVFGSGASASNNIARHFITKPLKDKGLYEGNHRFLVVKTDDGYSAHRIYLAVKSAVLAPAFTTGSNTSPAMKFRTLLRCDETVANLIKATNGKKEYGVIAYFGDSKVEASYGLAAVEHYTTGSTDNDKVAGMTDILRPEHVINDKIDTRLETIITGQAYIELDDSFTGDMRVTSAVSTERTVKSMVQMADNLTNLNEVQKRMLGRLYDRWGAYMTDWQLKNKYTTGIEKCICGSGTTTHLNGCDGEKLTWYEWDLDEKPYLPNVPGNWYLTADNISTRNGINYFKLTSCPAVTMDFYDNGKVVVPVYRCTNTCEGETYEESMIYAVSGINAQQTALTDADLVGDFDLNIDLNGLKIQGTNGTRVFSGLYHGNSSGAVYFGAMETTDESGNTVTVGVPREYYRLSKMHLSICDTSAGKTGELAAYGTFSGQSYRTGAAPQGCVIWASLETDTLDLHNVTVNASNVRMGYGLALATNVKTNLYGCTVVGGTAQGYTRYYTQESVKTSGKLPVYIINGSETGGGAIWVNTEGDVTMHGGSITGGTSIYRYMTGSNGVMSDRAVGGGNVFVSTGGKFTVDGTVTAASITGGKALIYGTDTNPVTQSKLGAGGGVYVSGGAEFTVKGNVTITGNSTGTANGTVQADSTTDSNYVAKGYTASNTSDSNVYLAGTSMTVQNLTGTVGVTLNGYESIFANADANYIETGKLVADEAAGKNATGVFSNGVLRLKSNAITGYSVGYGIASIHPTDNDIRNGLVLQGHNNQTYRTAGEYTRFTRYWINTDSAAAGMEPTPAYSSVVGTWEELMATCIAITDTDGDTVLLIEVDACSISTTNANKVKAMVSLATGVPQDNISISASHQHSTPAISTVYWTNTAGEYTKPVDLTAYDGKSTMADGTPLRYSNTIYAGEVLDVNEGRTIRTNYAATFFAGVIDAAVAAMEDRAEATIQYGILDTTSGGNQYNFVRNIAYYKGDTLMGMNAVHHKSYKSSSGWTATYETDMDTTMQLVKFVRKNTNNIIMANFQTHPHMAGGDQNLNINADMVGKFRAILKQLTGAEVLYFSGAGGNVNTSTSITADEKLDPAYGQITETLDWLKRRQRADIYGEKLAKLAGSFVNSSNNMKALTVSDGFTGDVQIRVKPFEYQIWDELKYVDKLYPVAEGEKKASERLLEKARLMVDWSTGNIKMTAAEYNKSTSHDYDGDGVLDGSHWNYFVGVQNISQKDGDEIFSYYHAGKIYTRWERNYVTGETTGSFNITAYDLGGIGFIAAPYEMFQENGQQIKGNVSQVTGKTDYTQAKHFYDLGFTVAENPYPITIIASYANGGNGYIPSAVGFVNGGYSTDTTLFDYGTGERLAKQFVDMLRTMRNEDSGTIEMPEEQNPADGDE